jgi:hypothetical protein
VYNFPVQNTDASGYFTSTLTGLPSGDYTWRVKGSTYLATCGTITLGTQPAATFEAGTQRAGDVNGDNAVTSVDYSTLRASFGRSCGDPLFDPRADINGDCAVTVVDHSLLRRNFGSAGCALP